MGVSNNTPWITFFSQTGSEIVDLVRLLDRWPDLIITNKRPEHLRTIHPELEGKVVFVENKPKVEVLDTMLSTYDNPIITLHGWLRIMPAELCEKYKIYNGHPGLITWFPELKGKDPQIRAIQGDYDVAGCVIHKVTAGVDEGRVLAEDKFNISFGTEEEIWSAFRGRSLFLWVNFLKSLV